MTLVDKTLVASERGFGEALMTASQAAKPTMNLEDIRSASLEADQVAIRMSLARFTAIVFRDAGKELHVLGHILGSDRRTGSSPSGHGDDATVAVSLLLRIGSQLVSASAELIADRLHYAGAALNRQLVEVEYLAWAFETKDEEAARWLRSTQDERKSFFTPAKLRAAAGKHFRGVDYSYHCEIGGHPVPGSWVLLNDDDAIAQLMSDCLGHSGRIWDHIVRWAKGHPHGGPILLKTNEMVERYSQWKRTDLLTALPSSPMTFPDGW
jgi:hypothetical protein